MRNSLVPSGQTVFSMIPRLRAFIYLFILHIQWFNKITSTIKIIILYKWNVKGYKGRALTDTLYKFISTYQQSMHIKANTSMDVINGTLAGQK